MCWRDSLAVIDYPAARQNAVLGEWHSLMELISRGVQAGSINQAAATAAFRRVCQDLLAPDHGAKALAVLRGMARPALEGTPGICMTRWLVICCGSMASTAPDSIDSSVAARSPTTDPAHAPTVLAGMVYAASLDPDGLLVNADALLLSKHQFVVAQDSKSVLFRPRRSSLRMILPAPILRADS